MASPPAACALGGSRPGNQLGSRRPGKASRAGGGGDLLRAVVALAQHTDSGFVTYAESWQHCCFVIWAGLLVTSVTWKMLVEVISSGLPICTLHPQEVAVYVISLTLLWARPVARLVRCLCRTLKRTMSSLSRLQWRCDACSDGGAAVRLTLERAFCWQAPSCQRAFDFSFIDSPRCRLWGRHCVAIILFVLLCRCGAVCVVLGVSVLHWYCVAQAP